MTTTRFYFSSTTAAAVNPPFDADWGVTAAAVRRKLKTVPAGTGGAGAVGASETSATLVDVLNGQFVSDGGVLPVGPISGTFDLICQMRENSSLADMFQQVRIHVYDSTGTTKRGTIYDGQTFTTTVGAAVGDPNQEFSVPIDETRIMVGIPLVAGTTAQAGDILVVEHGARACNTSTTSRTSTATYRDDGVADFATLTAGQTTNNRPYLDLHLLSAPDAPTGLTADPTETDVDLDWVAPAGGSAPTSYEARIDAGGWTDVGNVLATTVLGLTGGTAYTAEVRSKNAAGVSAAASVGFTTDSPPPAAPYRVDLVAGPYSWTVTSADTPDYGPLAGFRFGWQLGTGTDPAPVQQPAPEAHFGLVVEHAEDVAELEPGSPVAIRVWLNTTETDPALCLWSFYGRVADMEARPHVKGMVVEVNATGYLADLAEYPYTEDDSAASTPVLDVPGWSGSYPAGVAEPVGVRVGSALESYLARLQQTIVARGAAYRYMAKPFTISGPPGWEYPAAGEQVTAALQAHPYATDDGPGRSDGVTVAADYLEQRFPAYLHELPGELVLDGGVATVDMATSPDRWVLEAGLVDFGVRWRKGKEDRANVVAVTFPNTTTGEDSTHVYGPPVPRTPQVVATVRHDTPSPGAGFSPAQLARMYVPETGEASGWSMDKLRVHLWADPDALAQLIPNAADHANGGNEDRSLIRSRALVVTGIPEQHNPTAAPWLAGQLSGVEFVMDAYPAHRFYVDVTLTRNILRPAPHYRGVPPTAPSTPADRGYLCLADVASSPTFSAVTLADVDPALTYVDARLIRSIADA